LAGGHAERLGKSVVFQLPSNVIPTSDAVEIHFGSGDEGMRSAPLSRPGTLVRVANREDLIVFFTALAQFLGTPLARSIMGLGLAASDDETVYEPARDQFWTIRLTRASILVRRGIDRKEIRPDIDPELVLETLGGPLNLHVLLRNRPADHDYVSRLVDLTLAGARPR
jgi:hypothetical protein